MHSFIKPQNIRGFTLLELAIVLAIGGFLIVGFTKIATNYFAATQLSETERKMNKITEALQQFLDVNERLPCPASLTAAPNTALYGVESSSDCDTNVAGTHEVDARGSHKVRIGALPVRSLNIDDDIQFDGWDRRFIYAVTKKLAQSGSTFDPKDGAIDIRDTNDRPAFMPEETLQYIVISTGINGNGGYTHHGKLYKACNSSSKEGDNCDFSDNVFTTAIQRNNTSDADAYDDIINYSLLTMNQLDPTIIPPKVISAFDLPNCPAGWSNMPELAGRAIVGMGALMAGEWDWITNYTFRQQSGQATVRMAPGQIFYPPENRNHKHPLLTRNVTNVQTSAAGIPVYTAAPGSGYYPFSTNSTGGNAGVAAPQENRQPYAVYIYCKKD